MSIIMEKKDYPSDKDITYFSFVSYGESNRQFLQKKLLQWYEENENKLIWVVDTTSYRTSIDWYSKSNQNKFSKKCYLIKQYSSIKCDLIDMDKQILKQVLLDNAQLVEKLEVLPRAYALEG